jgi:hypothetical protein
MKCPCGRRMKIKSSLEKVYENNFYDPDGQIKKLYYAYCKKCKNRTDYKFKKEELL